MITEYSLENVTQTRTIMAVIPFLAILQASLLTEQM